MGKPVRFYIAATLLFAALAASLWAVSVRQQTRLRNPSILARSADERRAVLTALETAWANRPVEPTAAHARDEKDFINRTALFVHHNFRHEVGAEAFTFYRRTVVDFFARYHSDDILGEAD